MGGGSEQTQEAQIPEELRPLFEALSASIGGLAPQAGGILGALLSGQGQPQLSPTQSLVGDLIAQRIGQNPILSQLGAAGGLAGGAPGMPQVAPLAPVRPQRPAPDVQQGLAGPGVIPPPPSMQPAPGTAFIRPALPPGMATIPASPIGAPPGSFAPIRVQGVREGFSPAIHAPVNIFEQRLSDEALGGVE